MHIFSHIIIETVFLHQMDQLSGQTTTTNFYLRICHKNPDEKSARRPTVFNL